MGRIKPQALLQQSKKKKAPARISALTIIIFTVIVILVAFSLYTTYQHWYQRKSNNLRTNLNDFEEQAAIFEESKKASRPSYAVLNTSKGSITLEIYKDAFPEVVNKFILLSQNGYFKGTIFHHVIKNYAILGGEKPTLGDAEYLTLKEQFQSHLATSTRDEAFMFGMMKAKHDSEGLELLITTTPIEHQDEMFILFGRVIKGEEVVKEIEEVETDENYQPKMPVEIIDITAEQDLLLAV